MDSKDAWKKKKEHRRMKKKNRFSKSCLEICLKYEMWKSQGLLFLLPKHTWNKTIDARQKRNKGRQNRNKDRQKRSKRLPEELSRNLILLIDSPKRNLNIETRLSNKQTTDSRQSKLSSFLIRSIKNKHLMNHWKLLKTSSWKNWIASLKNRLKILMNST